ncbi:MAG: transposase [Lentisphaerae bacterium]|nr:transposase [Lentisphaerota bacterium]
MFIGYDKKGGALYAKLLEAHRERGKPKQKLLYALGRVLDKDRGIYRNLERGVFMYDLSSNTYGAAPENYVPSPIRRGREQLLLDFGDAYFVSEFLRADGLSRCAEAIRYGNPDTLMSMISYYMLSPLSNCHAGSWWEGSYASILYPKANLTSQRISDFLAAIGSEGNMRLFFDEYFSYLAPQLGKGMGNILIDSTGLPNSVHFPLTAVSNHNGETSNEVRLIYVTHQDTGLPIYFRYCPGNVIDVSTLARTIAELKACGVNTKFSILDAGYYDHENAAMLYENGISFMLRLRSGLKLCKGLLAEHLPTLESKENLVAYNDRYLYVKRVKCELVETYPAYAYVCMDIERKNDEARKLFRRARKCEMKTGEVHEAMEAQGTFVIVTSRKMAREKVLPQYYQRQQIEQIFDIGKNHARFLPINVQTEETFRGHLLLTFIAAVAMKKIQTRLLSTVYNPMSLFLCLRNQKCKVYENLVVTQEPQKKANDCYKAFAIKCPTTLPRKNGGEPDGAHSDSTARRLPIAKNKK